MTCSAVRPVDDPRPAANVEVFDELLGTGAVITVRRTFGYMGGWVITTAASRFRAWSMGRAVQSLLVADELEYGFAAQGSFANRPAIYRDCLFERVRFKTLGGFVTGAGRFENCTFVNCRWEGHFAYGADLIRCRFIGRMNGCVWGGTDLGTQRRSVITGNDFTEAKFSDNVAWRRKFPVTDQIWPDGRIPRVDDAEIDG